MAGNTSNLTFKLFGKDVSASKAFGAVGKSASSLSVGSVAAFAVAGAAAFKFASDSVAAYTEAQTAQTKLEDAYKRFPALASGNIDAIRKIATERAKSTRFDDDATAAAAANLAQFGLNQKQLESMIPLVQDYAAKTGRDLPEASTLVGKAMLGNAKALKELGINFKPTGDKVKDFANLQKLLNQQVGGFAEKEGKTAAGQAQILGNQFGEVKESVGQRLMPVLMTLASFAIDTLIPAIQGLADWLGQNSDVLIPLAGFVLALVGAIKLWTIAQAALNIVMALNPIGLIVIAIAALIAAIVLLWQRNETFRRIVTVVWGAIQIAVKKVADFFMAYVWPVIQKAIGFIIGYYSTLWTAFTKVVGWIVPKVQALGGVFVAVGETIYGAFKRAFNGIAWLWNNTVGRLSFGVPDWVPGMGGKGFDVPDIPMLAKGGIVSRPTLALIGEAGPEAVVPLSRGGGMGTHYHLHLDGVVVGNSRTVGRDLLAAIQSANVVSAVRPVRG